MKSLHQTYTIQAPLKKVWQALVNAKAIDEWGGGPAVMSDRLDDFSLWGGDIWGKNTKVEKFHSLTQEWYAGKWDSPSVVSFNLHEKNGATIVELKHTNIPDDAAKSIEEGWQSSFVGPLKNLLESQRGGADRHGS